MAKAKNRYGKKSLDQNTTSYFLQEIWNDEDSRKRRLSEEIEGVLSPLSKKPFTLANANFIDDSTRTFCTADNALASTPKPELKPKFRGDDIHVSSMVIDSSMSEIHRSLCNGTMSPLHVPYRTDNNYTGFRALTDDLVSMVLELILKPERSIKPVYRAGMMAWGLRSASEEEDIVGYESIDLSILQIDKRVHQLGSRMFYGSHTFIFNRPERCKWWIKRIGSNFAKVRHLSLTLSTGWLQCRNEMDWAGLDICVFEDMCDEEQWFNVFSSYIQPHHNLHTIRITLLSWRSLGGWDRYASRPPWAPIRAIDRYALIYWRNNIFEFLKIYMRGIKRAIVRQVNGVWFPERDLLLLGLLMQQGRHTATQRSKKRTVGLTEALMYVKTRRNVQYNH